MPMYSACDTPCGVGFPIRKFTDQSLFAAPHDLSQRTTSFIASQRQGIHRMPFYHLITLIIDAHHARRAGPSTTVRRSFTQPKPDAGSSKDQLLRDPPERMQACQFGDRPDEGLSERIFSLHNVSQPANQLPGAIRYPWRQNLFSCG